jgi:hypothetical protein
MFFSEGLVLGPGAAFAFISYSTQVSLTLISCVVGMYLMNETADAAATRR